ncbi:MAG: YkgJ family cysteine cluster protein [Candidatus Aenigmarchaeota archaeon]|nr:YkgJ family cysteine cluster protein [Candidatus Aenigmarchaeota archaeon]
MVVLSGYCKSCNLCCRNTFVLPEEKDAIASRLGLLGRRKLKPVGSHFIIDADPCPFLTERGCSIYEERPLCCASETKFQDAPESFALGSAASSPLSCAPATARHSDGKSRMNAR